MCLCDRPYFIFDSKVGLTSTHRLLKFLQTDKIAIELSDQLLMYVWESQGETFFVPLSSMVVVVCFMHWCVAQVRWNTEEEGPPLSCSSSTKIKHLAGRNSY
ncbi:hypothetical protein CHARACLAT_022451 [Characodon lateralis]|uniref:Uncharacterized protein n=1 Tax=Characodon lateralis TaxID=208331 RepID=A0ABU7DVF5_9TELE|nr:hypothetical protein [Characodon lateralis]